MDPRLKRKIDIYVDGGLKHDQVDELWAELVHDSQALAYLASIVDTSEIDDEEGKKRVRTTKNAPNVTGTGASRPF